MDINDRLIRIFISSTFRDLMEERTYLVNKVFPLLRSMAEQRNVIVVPIDLRWGITNEQDEEMTHSTKVVSLCLREIENSRPFFIGITGQRYGWCPKPEEVNDLSSFTAFKEWMGKSLEEGVSVTELEMLYAVWRNSDPVHAGFYIKDCQADPDSVVPLERLKHTIRREASHRQYVVHDFKTPEELGNLITDDFKALLDQLYPEEDLSPLQRIRVAQQAFMSSRTRWYVPVGDAFSQLDAFLMGKDAVMTVCSESGMGKSSLVANWISKVMEAGQVKVACHFATHGQNRSHYHDVIDHLVEEICELFHLQKPTIERNDESLTPESCAALLCDLCYKIPSNHQLLILVDGLNQVVGGEDVELLGWLPRSLPPNVHLLLTTTPRQEIIRSLEKRESRFFHLQALQSEQRRLLAIQYLQAHGKQLSPSQLERVVSGRLCTNTLVLRTMIDELIAFGRFELLDERINSYLSAKNLDDFFQRMLSRIEEDFADLPVRRLMSLIAFSQKGVGETELQEIIAGMLPMDWSQFYCALSNHVNTQNGLIVFGHQMIHDAVLTRYADLEDEARKDLIRHFEGQRTPRAYDELAHQYSILQRYNDLYPLLCQFPVFEHHYTTNEHLLYTYWYLLEQSIKGEGYNDDYKGFYVFQGMYPRTVEQARIYHHLGLFYEKYFLHDIGWEGCKYDTVSLEFFKRAYEIMRDKMGEDNIHTVRYRIDLAFKQMHVEHYREADQLLVQEGLDTLRRHLGDSSPILAGYYLKYGLALLEKENERDKSREKTGDTSPYDVSQPLKYYEMAADIYKRYYGEDHPMYADVLRYIGTAYKNIWELEKAYDYIDKALKIQLRSLSDNDMEIGHTYIILGRIHWLTAHQHQEEDVILRRGLQEQGIDLAHECYKNAHRILTEALGEEHTEIIRLNVIIHDQIIMYYYLEARDTFDMMESAERKGQLDVAVVCAQLSLHYYMKYHRLSGHSPSEINEDDKIIQLKYFLSEHSNLGAIDSQ